MKTWVFVACLVVGVVAAESAAPNRSETPARAAPTSKVVVTVKSDGNTWVSITNVAQPEKFKSKTFSLSPGDYTVMGRRKGYRDVEHQLRVRADEAPGLLTVICTVGLGDK